jgi:hypothetical protein
MMGVCGPRMRSGQKATMAKKERMKNERKCGV